MVDQALKEAGVNLDFEVLATDIDEEPWRGEE